jgi:hypothetical protein
VRFARASRDVAASLFIAAFFVAWYAPGVLGGRIYFAEDIAANFFASRSVLYAMAHGGGFSWWDPLPGLGMPRLANIQNGCLSPVSVFFYLIPTAKVFSFYPALVLGLLALFSFGLFRARGVDAIPALFGALSWATLGNVATHVQHPPAIETLLWLPATLLAWQRYSRSGRGAWAALAGVGVAFQCLGGSPQYVFYNFLVMGVWIGIDLWEKRSNRRLLARDTVAATAVLASGLALASWQLLPFLELAQDVHRNLLSSPDRFADMYRAAPWEIALAFAVESFWWIDPPRLEYGGVYHNLPNLSLISLGFALLTWFRRPRRPAEWVAVAFFLLGMLGSAGGVTRLLGTLIPFAGQLRAPIRMIVPAAFLVSWLAAYGMHGWLRGGARGRRVVAIAAVAWIAGVGWALKRPADQYTHATAFRIPDAIRTARPRIAVDIFGSRGLPRFGINAGVAAGVPSLLMREAVWPRNYFEAIFASQLGSLDQRDRVDQRIAGGVFPLKQPSSPLMRAFRLSTVIRYEDGRYRATPVPGALDRFFVAPQTLVAPEPQQRWKLAASHGWNSRLQVIVSEPLDDAQLPDPDLRRSLATSEYGQVRVLDDQPDAVSLEVASAGGVLVTSGLMYPGWRVRVDSQPVRPLEVDLALRGVVVPEGRHRVDWSYRPAWLSAAYASTALAIALLLAMTLLLRPHPDDAQPR